MKRNATHTASWFAGLAICSMTSIGHVHGQATIEESFDYATGNVGGQNGGTGFTAAWSATRGNPTVTAPDKIWGALGTAGNYSRGAAWSGVIRPIGTTLLDANLLDDGATLWFSVVLDLDGQNASNADISVALCNADKFDSVTFGNRENLVPTTAEGIGVTHSGAVVQGVYWTNDNLRTELSSSLNIGPGRALIVGKIDWGATALDAETITLYAPGLDLSLGTPILAATATAPLDQTTFNQIAIQYKDTSQVDEIRFGATSADVLPVSTTVPTLAPADIVDNQGGGPIGEDIGIITYTLTFNVPMDIGTITDADFDNAGTATATIGSITQPDQTTIEVQVLPTTTGTVQLRIPATSVLSGYNGLDLDTNAAILDDTTITIDAGATPDTGNRYWDGGSVDLTGPTDGVSQGGSGTWNTTTLNWDKGAGFADPVSWNNSSLSDVANFGGTANSTITVEEDINLGGLNIVNANTTTFNGAFTFNFSAGGSIVHDQGTGSRTATINQGITGGPSVTVAAGEGLTLNPGALTQALGNIAVNPRQNGTADNRLTIRGTSTSNTAGDIVQTTSSNGQRTTLEKRDAGTWTVGDLQGAFNARLRLFLFDAGRLVVTGDITSTEFRFENVNTTLELQQAGNLTTASSVVNPFRGTIDNTSGSLITFAGNPAITFSDSFTLAGNSVNMGTGATNLGTATRNITVSNAASTLTFGGVVSNTGGITKLGDGTLELTGANSYSGNTSVDEGTLALTGGSQNSAITVAADAKLGFTLGSPTTSTKAVTLSAGHGIAITGTVDNASDYQLMTITGGPVITGTPADPGITGYALELQNSNTELWLVYTGTGGSPFDTWANGTFANGTLTDKTAGGDDEGDTLTNLREFAFGTDPTVNFTGPMVYVAGGDVTTPGQPVLLEEGGTYYAVFGRRKDHVAAGLTYTVQFSADLISPWFSSAVVPVVVTGDPSAGDIEAVRVPFPGLIATESGPQKATFFRLEVLLAP